MNSLKRQLVSVVRFLTSMRIDYVILGGVAVSLYGEPRFTADIDVNIILEKQRIDSFIKESKKYGFSPACKNIRTMARKTGVLPMKYSKGATIGRCDFIIAENIIERLALQRGKARRMGSFKVRTVSPEDLIIHKMAASRARDIEDVRGILLRQRGRLDMPYIEHWLMMLDKASKHSQLLKSFRLLRQRVTVKT